MLMLTHDQEKVLANALSATSCFRDPEITRLVLDGLPFRASIGEHSHQQVTLLRTIRACAGHDTGFDLLLDAMCFFESAQSMDPVYEVLDRIFFQPVSLKSMAALKAVLGSHFPSREEAINLYQLSSRNPKRNQYLNHLNPLSLLDLLAKESMHSGDAPLFRFLALLMEKISDEAALTMLKEWWRTTQQQLQLNLDPAVIRKNLPAGKVPAQDQGGYTLVFIVAPVLLEQNKYFLKGWVVKNEGKQRSTLARLPDWPEHALPLMEIPHHMERLLLNRFEVMHAEAAVSVEVFLPLNLLDEPMDQWEIKMGARNKISLGSRHPLMIRSYDRHFKNEYRGTFDAWREKWHRLTRENRFDPQCICWVDTLNDEIPFEELVHHKLLFVRAANCDSTVAKWESVLMDFLDAGIPVGLWFRKEGCDSMQLQQDVPALLRQNAAELPGKIWRKRTDRKANLYHHLSLMWDNPLEGPPQETAYHPPLKS